MLILPLDILGQGASLTKAAKYLEGNCLGTGSNKSNQTWAKEGRKRKGTMNSVCCWICWLLGQHLFDLLQPHSSVRICVMVKQLTCCYGLLQSPKPHHTMSTCLCVRQICMYVCMYVHMYIYTYLHTFTYIIAGAQLNCDMIKLCLRACIGYTYQQCMEVCAKYFQESRIPICCFESSFLSGLVTPVAGYT